jgi:predicted peroxiredoxin
VSERFRPRARLLLVADLLFLLCHSTEEPDRAANGLATALAASEAGHDVALWLTGEGVRLGVKGVAETLREPTSRSAVEMVEALAGRGVVLHCVRPSFERREFKVDALRNGARLAEEAELGALIAAGRVPVTL